MGKQLYEVSSYRLTLAITLIFVSTPDLPPVPLRLAGFTLLLPLPVCLSAILNASSCTAFFFFSYLFPSCHSFGTKLSLSLSISPSLSFSLYLDRKSVV